MKQLWVVSLIPLARLHVRPTQPWGCIVRAGASMVSKRNVGLTATHQSNDGPPIGIPNWNLRPGQLTATVYMRTSLQNATMGVQLGYGPELVVKCPFSGADHPGFTPCHPATFTVPTAGANVLRLRSIGWEKSFRAYSIANVSFTKGG